MWLHITGFWDVQKEWPNPDELIHPVHLVSLFNVQLLCLFYLPQFLTEVLA